MAGESVLQRQCIKCAENYGLIARKVNAEAYRGWPDLMVMFKGGDVIWFELKNPNGSGRLSELQKEQCKLITAMGGEVYIIASLEAFFTIITRKLNSKPKGK